MNEHSKGFKYLLLASLYFTQMLPLGFVFSGLTVIMRQAGYSLQDIAYLYAIGMPYVIKFLWAPMVDRNSNRPNHYKKIIFAMTLGYAIMAAIASQINPANNLVQLVVVLTIAMAFLATQDIAVDALATRILATSEQGVGNGIQAAGAFCGYFFGGGVVLIFFEQIGGWSNAILLLTAVLILALIPLFFLKEPAGSAKSRATIKDIVSLFKIKQILPTLYVAFVAGVFLEVAYRKMRPLLTDAGFSFREIGVYISIIGMSSGIIASILFGVLIKQIGLRKAFLLALIFTLFVFPILIFPAQGYLSLPYILAAVLIGGAASGAIHTTVYALFMSNGRPGREGTDFTVQNAISFLLANGAAVFFGRWADFKGYTTLFITTGVLHLILVLVAFYLVKPTKPNQQVLESLQSELPEIAESEGMTM